MSQLAIPKRSTNTNVRSCLYCIDNLQCATISDDCTHIDVKPILCEPDGMQCVAVSSDGGDQHQQSSVHESHSLQLESVPTCGTYNDD